MTKKYFMKNIFSILLLLVVQAIYAQTPTKCFEIESILVDACDGTTEAKNEMIMFRVGPNAININDLRIDGAGNNGNIQIGKWPTTNNSFLGIASPPPVNIDSVAYLNSTITACGRLLEPVGGILLPGVKVMLVTSEMFTASANDFSSLTDTIYIIFQNDGSAPGGGNFGNFGTTNPLRTLVLTLLTGGADTVIYDKSLLTRINGTIGAEDGGAVSYTWDGTPTYYNNGCQAPYSPTNPSWTAPATMCADAAVINLDSLITGTSGGVWSGTGVTGNTFDPAAAIGSNDITYTLGTATCQAIETHSVQVIPLSSATWSAPSQLCQANSALNLDSLLTGTPGGTWSGNGVTGNHFSPASLSGSITITYTVGTNPCIKIESHGINVVASANAAWLAPDTICESATAIDLNLLVSGTMGGTWSGNGVTGNIFSPTGLSGNNTITYNVGIASCNASQPHTIYVSLIPNAHWAKPAVQCQTNVPIDLNTIITGVHNGIWIGNGVMGHTFNPQGLQGNIPVTYTAYQGACSASYTDTILVYAPPSIVLQVPDTLCKSTGTYGLNQMITGTLGGIWSGNQVSGNTLDLQNINDSVKVTYTISNPGCTVVVSKTIRVDKIDAAFVIDPVQGEAPLPIAIANTSTGAVSFAWNFGNNTSSTESVPAITYDKEGIYSILLTATSSNGCTDTASVSVEVYESNIFIPNVFTPDGDIKNESFYPVLKNTVTNFKMIIYNRWGKKIFTSTDQKVGWDGNNSASGVYYYIINYSLPTKKKEFSGTVTLIR